MSEGLFRPRAIEARSRVVRLQNKMSVTTPTARKALLALVVLAGVGVAWSAWVSVPIRVGGNGVFVERTGELLKPARAAMDGVVESLLVVEGDRVEEGQPVARLRLPERLNTLARLERDHAAAKRRVADTEQIHAIERESEARSRAVRHAAIVERLGNLERRLVWQTDTEADTMRLLDQGIATRTRVNEVRVATQQLLDQIATARGELAAIEIESITSANRMERERLTAAADVHRLASEKAAVAAEIARGTLVTSPVAGRVAELSAERNGTITAGQPLLSVIPTSGEGRLEAIAFVGSADGKLVKVGDVVHVRPSSLPAREQGRMRGVVTDVSDAPVTDRALARMLGNQTMVAQMTNRDAPFAVRIALEPDPATPSGYEWTSGQGPDIRLGAGTPVTARITIERETLLTLAVPALRRAFGVVH
jgi:NHLM bacteriocin system secretion protein